MLNMKGMTYADAGVDMELQGSGVEELLRGIGSAGGSSGHYAGVVEVGKLLITMTTDGVGTKIIIAEKMNKWDTIGIDCIAMNVNDIICLGATPIAFVDYIATPKVDKKIMADIGRGLGKGAEISGIKIIGGEVAVLPEMLNTLDLSGTCIGISKKEEIITGEKIKIGDVIIGLRSSGIHSNGLTMARKVLKINDVDFNDYPDDGEDTVGNQLLTPTRIYVKSILRLLRECEVHGLAHITGGGVRNLCRLKRTVQFRINSTMNPHPIFIFLKRLGKITWREMYQTFNMGMGFAVIVPENYVDDSMDILEKSGEECKVVGKVIKGKGVVVTKYRLSYERY